MSGTLKVGSLVLTKLTANQDAFDRLRISVPNTLFEIMHTYDKNPYMIDEITSGTGASNHNSTNSYVQMTVTAANDKVVRQTFEYLPYQNGKSRLMIFSAVMETHGGVAGVICRIGTFDSSTDKTVNSGSGNGLFFELNGTTMKCVIRNNNTDMSESQSAWNFDKFNGNGPSRLTVNDYSKAMIYAIDQEWLGIGRVRFGFFINGKFHVGHVFNHSGIGLPTSTGVIVPYTKTAKLPIRYEISNNTTASGEMRMICSTVLSECGYNPAGHMFSIGRSSPVEINNSAVISKPIISLKLIESEPYNRKTIFIKKLSIYNKADTGMTWSLYMLPSSANLTGASWQPVMNGSSIAEYDVSATVANLTGAVLLHQNYASYYETINFKGSYISIPKLNSSINGTSRVLCLVGKSVAATLDSFGSFSWIEIT